MGSYRFCFGASGAGKSTFLQREMVQRAQDSLRNLGIDHTQYLYIVPEQYTMQTQKDLVMASPSGGIMNVDVLSFGRLGHRIFEETGSSPRQLVNDMGKNLILRHLAGRMQKEGKLGSLGRYLNHPGMISEVKSTISEFMQYGIAVSDVQQLINAAQKAGYGALQNRLADIQQLYAAFEEYEKENGLSANEELMDMLAAAVQQSQIIRRSVIVFDGFTGFTPVQYHVLQAILQNAREVTFSITISEDGGIPLSEVGAGGIRLNEENLFYLSRRTVRDLVKIAQEAGATHAADIDLNQSVYAQGIAEDGQLHNPHLPQPACPPRFAHSPQLAHLERHLFRNPVCPWHDADKQGIQRVADDHNPQIQIFHATTPLEEVREACIRMCEMVRRDPQLYWREIGVVTGSPSVYSDLFAQMAAVYEIPVYLDRRSSVLHNPLTEAVSSALEIISSDFSYKSVFRFLRSGLSDLTAEETDRLENYCIAHNVRYASGWSHPFSYRRRGQTITPAYENRLRASFMQQMQPLLEKGQHSTADWCRMVYAFLKGIRAQEKMADLAKELEKSQEQDAPVLQMQYEQIYKAVIDLLDQIYTLLGEEILSAEEFSDIMRTGFAEIRLGTLPQKADRVLVGDIVRSRLSEVKVLFFLGVNDGNIPQGADSGGLLSDLEREFLTQQGFELAPTPRQQMYTQRLYLYLNMTKTSEHLILSYSRTAADGSSIRPSYLIRVMQNLFPDAEDEAPEEKEPALRLMTTRDTASFLSRMLRYYARGEMDPETAGRPQLQVQRKRQRDQLFTVYGYYHHKNADNAGSLMQAAFLSYRPFRLSKEASRRLYGSVLHCSISRLETAAGCYMQQFLAYGLRLQQREQFQLTPADNGTILHAGMQKFSGRLRDHHLTWRNFTKEQGSRLIRESIEEAVADLYQDNIMSSGREQYRLTRILHMMETTVAALQYQIRQGDFEPDVYEYEFGGTDFTFDLGDGRKIVISGKIDRIDVDREPDRTLVKIIDYKSGRKDLDDDLIRRGLQMQLLVYMQAAMKIYIRQHPDRQVVPAALLYYRFDEPVLSAPPVDDADARLQTMKSLRPTGSALAQEDVLTRLDRNLALPGTESSVLRVRTTKKGDYYKKSKIFTPQQYEEWIHILHENIRSIARRILDGDTAAEPVRFDERFTACSWCPFRDVCGFDPKIPGYREKE